jgi:hypothetical protein
MKSPVYKTALDTMRCSAPVNRVSRIASGAAAWPEDFSSALLPLTTQLAQDAAEKIVEWIKE